MEKIPMISYESLEFIRKILPFELKNRIYAYIDVETRLDIILENKQSIINDLYIIPESALIKLFDVCIESKITVKLGSVGYYNSTEYDKNDPYLSAPTCNYKSKGVLYSKRHPIEREIISNSTLINIPYPSVRKINNPNCIDYKRVAYIINRILGVINLYSSIYTTITYTGQQLSTFDYAIRKRLFHFIHCIHKRIVYYKQQAAEKTIILLINKCERIHRRLFKKRILKAVIKKSLIMCKQREKKARKEAKTKAKLEKNEAATKAKLEKNEAATKAKLEHKEAATNAKIVCKYNLRHKI